MRRSKVENQVRRYLLGEIEWSDLYRKVAALRLKYAEETRTADQVIQILGEEDSPGQRWAMLRAWYAFWTRYRKNLGELESTATPPSRPDV